MSALLGHGFQAPPLPAVGRFYNNGKGWCSGTMLFAGIVLTAGHCLHGAESGQGYYPPSGMVFVPGNTWNGSQGTGSYGTWQVANAFVTDSYARLGSEGLDWGLAVLAPDATGRFAGDYTGTFPSYGAISLTTESTDIVRMGYPASGPWTDARYQGGNGQYYCNERFSRIDRSAQNFLWLRYDNGCPMNGGSSGGPNFVKFADGTWGIVGVNNRGCGPCPHNPANPIGFGVQSSQIWFDQTYVDFVNNVIAILNGQARVAGGPGAAVSVRSLREGNR